MYLKMHLYKINFKIISEKNIKNVITMGSLKPDKIQTPIPKQLKIQTKSRQILKIKKFIQTYQP